MMKNKLLTKEPLFYVLTLFILLSQFSYGQARFHIPEVKKTVTVDCGQGDDSNNFENGKEIAGAGLIRHADDFMVSPNSILNIRSIELNIFALQPITTFDINFYNDDNGSPGSTLIESVSGLEPYSQRAIGTAFTTYTVYSILVEVDLNFEGGTSGANFWMEPIAQNGSPEVYWEISTLGTLGEPIHGSAPGIPWQESPDGAQGVFKLYCEVVSPPPFECLFEVTAGVEPITRLLMANVDNSSPPTSTVALEDFTNTVINTEVGATIDVALEGNTEGAFTNYFTIFINTAAIGDEAWSSFEAFEIGSITGSTGTDGQQATATITLPSNLQQGEYLLRVVKNFNDSPLSPCGIFPYGQGEDYTLNIDDVAGVNDSSTVNFTFYPNPVVDLLNITAKKNIGTISAFNLFGQKVISDVALVNGKVHVSALSTGIYIFQISFDDGQTENFKILKK